MLFSSSITMGIIMKPLFVYIIIGIVVLFLLSHSPKINLPTQQPQSQIRYTSLKHNAAAEQEEEDDPDDLNNKIFLLFPEIEVDYTQREMIIYDKNRDGFVSFSESGISSSTTDGGDDMMLLFEEERLNASDTDGDRLLNLAEFNHFLHSANTNNLKLRQWLCKEGVWESHTDRDGKVDFREFFYSLLFDLVRKYDEENCNGPHHSDDSMDASANVFFSQLEKDCDEYSSDIELLPIIGTEHYYATKLSENFISQTQDDKDGHLTLIENAYTLYAAIFPDEFF